MRLGKLVEFLGQAFAFESNVTWQRLVTHPCTLNMMGYLSKAAKFMESGKIYDFTISLVLTTFWYLAQEI